ncbi:MAG: hypothetical protein RL885_16890 [Planctomycetota bacterium]
MIARLPWLLVTLSALAPFARAQVPQELHAPGLPGSGGFGKSVAMDDERVVVGAVGLSQPGQCFIFERSQGFGSPFVLAPVTTEVSNNFGNALSLDGNQLAVGASWEGDRGAVYIYNRVGEDWVQEAVLHGSDFIPKDASDYNFGYDVAIHGDHLVVVGLTRCDFFERVGRKWVRILAVADSPGRQSIRSCDVEGDTAVVGYAYTAHPKDDGYGVAYVYHFDGRTWKRAQTLIPPDSPNFSSFGSSLDLDGDRLAVGALSALVGEENDGAVYVYRRLFRGKWFLEQKVVTENETPKSWFGKSVALSGERLLVGAPESRLLGELEPGAMHLFRFAGGSWMEMQTFTSPHGYGPWDEFGESVAISQDQMAVASHRDHSAWVYHDIPSWRAVDGRFRLVAEILVGVSTGGGGIIIVPGVGPVPVDEYPPDPILPVFTMILRDDRQRTVTLKELLTQWPDQEFRVTRSLEEAMAYPDRLVVLLTDDIGRQAEWIVDSAEDLKASRQAPLVLLGIRDDASAEILRDLIDKGFWQ